MTDNDIVERIDAAAAFNAGVLELARKHGIEPTMLVGLFGYMTKHLIDHHVEVMGQDQSEATAKMLKFFMRGLGFVHEALPDPKDTH
jgi:hypothetical protein